MSFLQKKIFDLTPEVFAVEISDYSVKVLQLEKEGGAEKIKSFAAINLPPGAVEDGKIINADAVITTVKEALKRSKPRKISTCKVVCSVPESKVFLRRISIPKLVDKEISEAIKWEMEANIPLPIDQVYFDWKTLNITPDGKQNMLTAAVSKETADELIAVLEKAGLEVYGLEVESMSSARSLINEKIKTPEEISLIIDLGLKKTIFSIIVRNIPCFTSSLPFSIEGISEALSKKMNIPLAEVQNILVANGITDPNNPIASVIQPILENFAQEAEKTLDFFMNVSKDNLPFSRITIAGFSSIINGFPDFLAQRMKKNVEVGNPLANLNLGKDSLQFLMNQGNPTSHTTIIGLALWALNYNG